MALMASFSRRSVLRKVRSLWSHCRSAISLMPISTVFSTSHSVRAGFLVGASARWRRGVEAWDGKAAEGEAEASTRQALGLASKMRQSKASPRPLVR